MEYIFRLFVLLVVISDFLLRPIYTLFYYITSTPTKLPKIEDKLLLYSACDLAQLIKTKQITCETLVRAYAKRIKDVNPIINAVADDRISEAIQEAQSIDRNIDSNDWSKRPFLGVPLTVKETCGLKGLSQSVGSLRRKGVKCTQYSEVVVKARNAGFIPLLVSTCPEFCIGVETINLVNGITRNPYNTTRSAGGSSGGEGALIASAASIVGLGSDYAGSIRIPALFNGIFGHKPTPRTISSKGHYPSTDEDVAYDYFTIGPMARYAIDLQPFFKCLLDDRDIEILQLDQRVELEAIKVFYSPAYFNMSGLPSIDRAIQAGIENATRYLHQHHKMCVSVLELDGMDEAMEIAVMTYLNVKNPYNFLQDPKNPKQNLPLYCELIKSLFGQSELSIFLLMMLVLQRWNGFLRRSLYNHYQNKLIRMKECVKRCLKDDAVLLFPTFTSSAFYHYQVFTKSPGGVHAMIFNLLGCPSTQIPIGLDSKRMPIGFQVAAAPYQDRLCLAVAVELERCFGGWQMP